MTTAPLISVVIPSYNYARFLDDCLTSVAQQDYPQLELIVVDDMSTDDSPRKLAELAACDDINRAFAGRVHIEINARNIGAHDTINRGIERSTGSYIGVLNADDMYAPGRLRQMMRAIQAEESRFAFSRVDFVDERGLPFTRPDPLVHRLLRSQTAIARFPTVGFACLASNVAISTGNFLFERKLFDEVGRFGNLRYCHDWDFLLRCLLASEPIYVPEAGYKYRIHGSNTFRSLDHVAASESALVYQAYFSQLILDRHSNRRAPGPLSWPGVFETFMTAYGLWQFWSGDKSD